MNPHKTGRTGVVLVGHGSLRRASGVAMIRLAADLKRRDPHSNADNNLHDAAIVTVGFLNYSRPDFGEVVARAVAKGATELVVQPYFLIGGHYVQTVVPALVAVAQTTHPAVRFTVAAPFGDHPTLAALVQARADAVAPMPERPALLLLAHGTPEPQDNAPVHGVAARLETTGRFAAVRVAFLACNSPGFQEAVTTLAREHKTLVVAPYFLQLGGHVMGDLPRLVAEARTAHLSLDLRCAEPLGYAPQLAEVIRSRVAEVSAWRPVWHTPPGSPHASHAASGRIIVSRQATKPSKTKGVSSLEVIKQESHSLRGTLAEQLQNAETHFDESGKQLLKFSGIYQQDDRDQRKARRQAGIERAHSFMIRSKVPGGVLSAEQYLAHDHIASRYGNNTLRFTTRQGIQLHGVFKGDLKATPNDIHDVLMTTQAACGDVSRNVMGCPAPEKTRRQALITEVCRAIDTHLLPHSEAYYEVWLDGERQTLPKETKAEEVEPIYGQTYLPRKFKIGVAFPEDNCVDVFTQDIGIVPVLAGETLRGYNILVGGGLGMSHTDPETFPRLADRLGSVAPEQLIPTVEAIVTVQRDFGNRENRKQARMKYLLHRWGVARFRQEVEARTGFTLGPWLEVGDFKVDDHLGWHAQGDGRYYYGIPIENGRIHDTGAVRLRSGLREVVTRFGTELRITAQHNLLVTDLEAAQQGELLALLKAYGIKTKEDISNARRYAIACPALPTCGLALAEAERVLPAVIDAIEGDLETLGLAAEPISIRMTGCPNGCARPYTAELAFVGRSLGLYNVYLGGSFEGTRLVEPYRELVPLEQLAEMVRPLFVRWQQERRPGEALGDFYARVGVPQTEAAPTLVLQK